MGIEKDMKKFILPSLFGVLSLLMSCSEDNTMLHEPEAIRPYETDAQIMAQFLEVDKTSGTYILNPDKKITATDYVLNKSRDELMSVSPINKDRFLKEMESVNSQLTSYKQSGIASAYIYSTQTSNVVIDGNDKDSFIISKLTDEYYKGSRITSLSIDNEKRRNVDFFSQSKIVMTINSGCTSTFYCSQINLGDQNNKDEEIIVISGIKSFIPVHSYNIYLPEKIENQKTISGINLLGAGNLTVSISQ